MTDVVPIQPDPWERERAVVPVEGPRELAEWLESMDREGACWEEAAADAAPWGSGYAVVVAVRSPSGAIRYFMISGDDVRGLASRATGRVARFAERLGFALGPTLVPVVDRWRDAWRQTFVRTEHVADLLGVERAEVERWARTDPDFPLPVVERSRGPVYVREEIEEWIARRSRPRP